MFVKWRKNGDLKRELMARKLYHLVEHKILNLAVYIVSRYYLYISRY